MLQTSPPPLFQNTTIDSTNLDSCTCPAVESGLNLTATFFQTALSAQIDALVEEGQLSPGLVVDLGSSVIQGREADCESNVTEFNSGVATGLVLDADSLQPEEIFALEQSFSRAYNRLTFLNCDVQRRTSKVLIVFE